MANWKKDYSELDFVNRLETSYKGEGYLTKREINSGHGVADLVLARLNEDKCNIRLSYGQKKPLLKEYYFRALRQISDIKTNRPPTSIESLLETTHLSPSFLKYYVLKNLEKAGYIKVVDKKWYYKINGWVPIVSEMIAIEGKLKDWKQGLMQANRYKDFADKVYLAIPNKVGHLPTISLLHKFGVGLIVFDPQSGIRKIIVKATSSKFVEDDKRNFVAENFWF